MFETFKTLLKVARSKEIAPISRRYFVMNGFDGGMTLLGIVLGSLIVGINQQTIHIVVSSSLGSIMAIGFSGLTGAFLAEKAERARELNDLERRMLKKMRNTDIGVTNRFASVWVAIVDSSSPVLVALSALSPLLLALFFPIPPKIAAYASVGVNLGVLFLLGAYLGKISRKSKVLNGLKMIATGVVLSLFLLLSGHL